MTKSYPEHVVKLANNLYEASQTKQANAPLIDQYPNITVEDAYAVQLYNINREIDEGKSIVGKKIGLTSKPMQELAGVDEPDYGHLMNDMEITSNNPTIYMDQVLLPRVEGELAFILKKDLVGPNVSVEEVLEATEYIVPAIEIVDSRIKDWKIKLKDTVGDNGSSAYFILGENKFRPKEVNRIDVKMQLFKNGSLINEGTGADVLGDPAYCVAWLANKLYEYDIILKKNEVILAGALTKAIDAKEGDIFTCRFSEGMGEVTINFKDR